MGGSIRPQGAAKGTRPILHRRVLEIGTFGGTSNEAQVVENGNGPVLNRRLLRVQPTTRMGAWLATFPRDTPARASMSTSYV